MIAASESDIPAATIGGLRPCQAWLQHRPPLPNGAIEQLMVNETPPTRPRRLPLSEFSSGLMALPEEAAHYIRGVLRLQSGAAIEVFDGKGRIAPAQITRIEGKLVEICVGDIEQIPPPALALTLAVATPKGDRADWLVEKSTELGASAIIWLTCKRSVVVPRKAGKKLERWVRIAEGAARQSGRAHTPSLQGPIPLTSLLEQPFDHRFVCDWSGPSLLSVATTRELKGSVVVVVGPEGGLSGNELEVLAGAGYNSVSLGPNVLRVETASVAATATLMGDS